MKQIVICALVFIISFGAYAQTPTRKELIGVTHTGPGQQGSSSATYAIGMSLDGNASFVETARLQDSVVISGVIRPEAAHIGLSADIFVVDRVNLANFFMRDASSNYIPWNGNVPTLTPFLEDQILSAEFPVELFAGSLEAATVGDHRFFLGYKPADGVLRYTPIAARVEFVSQTVRDQAFGIFTSSISNIVQTNCIVCHTSGGLADGRSIQKFVSSNNPDHLTINFAQFENLVNVRGREFVLTKVRGGNNHEGGVVLVNGSPDYNNLSTFLSLLESL
ncbi:MAG: hypothetical protein V4628_03815 [Pseudomonadota bacterium]